MKFFFTILISVAIKFYTYSENYNVFEENGKFGLKNGEGQVKIPAVYDGLGWSTGNFSVLGAVTGYKQNDQWGLITITNQTLSAAEYFALYPGSADLLVASKRSPLTLRISTGCIDSSGKIIIPFSYSGLTLHSLTAITYTLDGNQMKYGLIDLSNKTIVPQLYQNIYPIGSLRYAVQNFNSKTALFSENGKRITDFLIDSISQVNYGFAVYYQDGRAGLINREGQIIKQPIYREIQLSDKTYQLRLPDEWYVLDAANLLIKKMEADSIVPLGHNRLKIVTGGGTQLADMDFNPIGVEKTSQLSAFQNGLSRIQKNCKTGVLRKDGSVLLPAQFDDVVIDKGFLLVCSEESGNYSCALYDTLGQKKTNKAYHKILPFNGSFFPVLKNGFYGGVDKNGNEIIACAYDSLGDTFMDLVVARFKGHYGIITLREEWKVFPQHNRINLINTERFFEQIDDLTFLKSMDGKTIYFTSNKILLQEDYIVEYITGGGKWKINLSGQIFHREVPTTEPTEITFPSSEGLRGIKKNGKYGFIDDLGRLRIANRYENIGVFQEGLAAVKLIGKWGFINKEDNIVIQPAYDQVNPFENGFSKVRQNGKYGLINSEGKIHLDFRYDELDVLENGRVLLQIGRQVGLADIHGNILLQPKYESVEDLNNEYVIVKQNGKFGVVNLHGVSTIPIHYDHLIFETDRNRFIGLKKSEFTPFISN